MDLRQSLLNTQTRRAQQPIPGQAANLRQSLAARSGKAGATSGPAISNIQEQAAALQVEQAATEQQQAAQLDVAAQQQAQQAQEQQYAQQLQRTDMNKAQALSSFDQAVTKIDNQLKRFGKDLDSQRGRDAYDQALFARRLADDKYITKLTQDGQLRRLDDANAFEIEVMKTAFANQMELFENDVQFNKMMQMDEAEFRKELARMSISSAQQILSTELAAQNTQSMYSSIGNLAQTGVTAATTEYRGKDNQKTSLAQEWLKD